MLRGYSRRVLTVGIVLSFDLIEGRDFMAYVGDFGAENS
jgi:hypothetical protein